MRNDTAYPFDDIYYNGRYKTPGVINSIHYSSEHGSSTVLKGVSEHLIVFASTEFSTPRIEDSYAEELRLARAGKRNARTALGRRLWEIRERAIAAGEPLVNLEDIERELDR